MNNRILKRHKDDSPVLEDVTDLFHPEITKPIRVIGIVGDPNNGKTNVINYIIETLKREAKDTQIAAHGLKNQIDGVMNIHTIEELERMRNSIVFIDEWADLVDVYNQRQMRMFEQSIRTIYQPNKNNIVILCGMARNYNGKISGMLNAVIFKQTTMIDVVQRSVLSNILTQYSGGFEVTKGKVLAMPNHVALVNIIGSHFHEVEVPYVESGDMKRNNQLVVKWNNIKAR